MQKGNANMYATLNEIGKKFGLAGELYTYETITMGNIKRRTSVLHAVGSTS